MKKPVILVGSLLICLAFASCLKDHLNKLTPIPVTTSNLASKWTLVNDTTTTSFWGIWGGRAPVGSNYIGQPGDYYTFTSYGKLYIHQNTTIDTQTYKLGHDTVWIRTAYIDGETNQVDSTYNPWYIITSLTSDKCTLTSFFITPETTYNSVINLSR
jgi:hypothetical protein